MTGVRVQGDEPLSDEPELTPAERAALKAAKAAKKADKAQRRAEKARRLAVEFAAQEQAARALVADPEKAAVLPADLAEPPPPTSGPVSLAKPVPAGRSAPLLVASGLAAAAAIFAVVAIVLYFVGSSSGASSAAATRDTVLLSARQDIVVLNTLDFRNVDAGLKRWAAASTGTLHQQITSATTAEKQQILAGQTVTTAKVLEAAVVSLDTSGGSASVIASVELTKTPKGKTPQVQRERLRATMARDGSTWKVTALQTVGVTLP